MALCGIKVLLVTNAAGGLHPSLATGDVMVLKDHVNLQGFAGISPLCGINDEKCVSFPSNLPRHSLFSFKSHDMVARLSNNCDADVINYIRKNERRIMLA